jgi:allantoinase
MLVIRGRRIVFPDGERAASVQVENGTIAAIRGYDDRPVGAEIVDADDLVVTPGLVDTHVHVNEPGRADWEGFDTATRAAAAGGVTTIIDMPLNSVPATTSVEALDAKREAARGKCHVNVGFWGGVVPGNEGRLEGLIAAGVRGFKCFLVPSGVEEFPAVDERALRRAMPVLARSGLPLLVHAESPAVLSRAGSVTGPPGSYATYLAMRPPEAELEAVRLMTRLAAEFGATTHIVHVAAAQAVEEIARARAASVPITAETCPHYLTFVADEIPDGATAFKCAPPIREALHCRALWAGLERGVLDLIATDHSPSPPALKCAGDFLRAWGGIASLELSLAATWTGARARGFSPAELAGWMSRAPASLAGLADRKGAIAPGRDADLAIWDPDAEFTVDPRRLQQRHPLTPYEGRRLRGVVMTTFVGGERVWDDGRLVRTCAGRFL